MVLNEQDEIVQKGSKKQVDFETIPCIIRPMEENLNLNREEEKEIVSVQNSILMDRVFCTDDDFMLCLLYFKKFSTVFNTYIWLIKLFTWRDVCKMGQFVRNMKSIKSVFYSN